MICEETKCDEELDICDDCYPAFKEDTEDSNEEIVKG